MNDKLTAKEKTEIVIQSGLQLVPYVGSSLSTAYFSTKQEKRFKRIESFYDELSNKISSLESQLPSFSLHDEESLISLIERLNDEIERESSIRKRTYFKNFFLNILQSPTVESNYDERRMLLETLGTVTFFEFQILLTYSTHRGDHDEKNSEIEPILKEGAISRLEMLGLLRASYFTTSFIGQSATDKHLTLSEFGKKFIDFCLE